MKRKIVKWGYEEKPFCWFEGCFLARVIQFLFYLFTVALIVLGFISAGFFK